MRSRSLEQGVPFSESVRPGVYHGSSEGVEVWLAGQALPGARRRAKDMGFALLARAGQGHGAVSLAGEQGRTCQLGWGLSVFLQCSFKGNLSSCSR